MNRPNWKNDDGRMLEDNYMGMKMAVARTTMNRINRPNWKNSTIVNFQRFGSLVRSTVLFKGLVQFRFMVQQ